jgi:dihydroorotase
MQTLTLKRPDDWHVHLRDGAMLRTVLPYTARQFARAIIMPNLTPPVLTTDDAIQYRWRIMEALPRGSGFTPLMTAYLSDHTDPSDLAHGFETGVFTAAKLYPAHATTNSAHGVTDVAKIHPVLERMQRIGMPLLIHGEVTDPAVDIFDREAVFIERVLMGIVGDFPALKIVLEHCTTQDAVDFVHETPGIAATITAHHMMINRNALFAGGLQPHAYCLPIVKRERHRLALRKAAASGHERFFLGTDTAPHSIANKEKSCGCAGIFTAPNAIEAYAQVFEEEHALDKLEAFASLNGPRWYGLAPNEGMVTLNRVEWTVADHIRVDGTNDMLHPFMAGETMRWQMMEAL